MASIAHWVTHIALYILISFVFVQVSGKYVMKMNELDYQGWHCPKGVESTWFDLVALGTISDLGTRDTLHCPRDRQATVVALNLRVVTQITTAWSIVNVICLIFMWYCEPAPLKIKQSKDSMPNTSDANTSDAKASDAKTSDATTGRAARRASTIA